MKGQQDYKSEQELCGLKRRMCHDESHFPTMNVMTKKLNEVSHKVKADASFLYQEKKAITNSKENKKQRQGINMKQRKCGK